MSANTDFENGFINKLNEMMNFPTRIKFDLYREKSKEKQSIIVSEAGKSLKKKKLENIRFQECQSILLDGYTATIHINDFDSDKETEYLKSEIKKLRKELRKNRRG